MPRFLIADDHALMRDAVEMTIERCWPDATIVQVGSFPAACAALADEFDLCVCDLTMPGATAFEGIQQLLSIQPSLRLIIITGSADEGTIRKVLKLSVSGLIPKTTDGAIVEAALRLVYAGGRYFPDRLANSSAPGSLTGAQKAVMVLMSKGHTNKEIAKELNIAPSTVKTHIDHILERLNARNRVDACQKFAQI